MRRGQGRRFLAGKLPSAKMLISAVKVGCSAVLRAIAFVFSGVAEYLGLIYGGACEALFDATLPVTKYLLSCKPLTPSLQVCEVSSTTVRLGIKGRLSSPWNVETYKVQRAELGANGEGAWETSYSDDGRYPSIGGLKPFHEYAFRVQASNFKGSSEWSSSTCVWTLMNPVDGGGLGPGYSWQQTSSEVVMDLPILRQLSEVKPKQVCENDRVQPLLVQGCRIPRTSPSSLRMPMCRSTSHWESYSTCE